VNIRGIVTALVMTLILIGPAPVKADMVATWNDIALQAIAAGPTSPPVASRALAITHAAIFDAVNSISPFYTKYKYQEPYSVYKYASAEAAVAQAGYTALSKLFPLQNFDAQLAASLDTITNGTAKTLGITLGDKIATDMYNSRTGDGSSTAQYPYTPISGPGNWKPTPPPDPPDPYLLPGWGTVTPFTMTSGTQFQATTGPPLLTSPEYAAAFNQVKDYGSKTSALRSDYDTNTAYFWADGVNTYTPPGHWNAIAQTVTQNENTSIVDSARTFALLNLALGDAAIVAWDNKLFYHFWRPVTAITAIDQGNPNTVQDPGWEPLLATPPFPAYTSGHSTFSAAAAAILAELFGDITTFESKTVSTDWIGPEESKTRTFTSFTEAMEQAGISRIYGGIHWDFDNFYGLATGEALGEYVFANFLVAPLPGTLVLSLSGFAAMFLARRVRRR
jgi:membrane-associated phospholipid phosphatase